jgi:cold-inducible RNA-binding protein
MSKRLFVGGLPYSVDNSQLEEMFAKFGKVASATVINDKYSGRSKGFGFVEMEDDKEAEEAIKTLDQSELDGRKIAVNVARPMEAREPRKYDSPRRDFGGGDRRQRDGRGGGSRRGGRY